MGNEKRKGRQFTTSGSQVGQQQQISIYLGSNGNVNDLKEVLGTLGVGSRFNTGSSPSNSFSSSSRRNASCSETMSLSLKNGADVQSVLEGSYTSANDTVNNKPYWIQVDGSNGLWYAKTGWGFGPKSILGYGYHDHVGLVLYSDDAVEDPTLVKNWKYWNIKIGWVQAENGDVNLQCTEK